MSERSGDILFYCLLLLLPLSALIARRIPLKSGFKMALAWLAIFIVGLMIVNQRDRFDPVIAGLRDALVGHDQMVSGSTVRIRMAEDGHLWAIVSVNGTRRRMLIDSGATTTALSSATASAAGVATDESPFPVVINTANGNIVARTATVTALTIGSIAANDLPVVVAPAFEDTDVIGMNFLSRLRSWRVEGRTMILEPQGNLT